MANLWDNRAGALSQSELNPLSNSVLERNLARWAKVYFSNPPEKREQAVSQLLAEIRKETAAHLAAEQARSGEVPQARRPELVCSVCQRSNPCGHQFCGRCGATLDAGSAAGLRTSNSAGDGMPAYSPSAARWRPNRALASLGTPEAARPRAWKYVVGGLAIALAGFGYVQWIAKPEPSLPSPGRTVGPRASAPQAALPVSSRSSASHRQAEILGASHPSEIPKPPAEQKQQRDLAPGVEPAGERSPLLDRTALPPGRAGLESGDSDLRLAQHYLGGSAGARDSAEAARLLWRAVGKRNSTATVLLSDLYLRGDGVARSCDQARLLLLSAAKRGAARAVQQLQGLESQGCR